MGVENYLVSATIEVAEANIPVAVLIVPRLIKVDFGARHRVAEE